MRRKVRKSQPDKVEKLLEDHADVFADIINAFIYHGEDVVKPEDLKVPASHSRDFSRE